MMGICVLYIASAILLFSIVVGQFLILFLSMDSFRLCVDAILIFVGLLFLHLILWFQVSGIMHCCYLLCLVKCNK